MEYNMITVMSALDIENMLVLYDHQLVLELI